MSFDDEHKHLTQFMSHIHRALDDAVLCQRLALVDDAITITPSHTRVQTVIIHAMQDVMHVVARYRVVHALCLRGSVLIAHAAVTVPNNKLFF